ncbi:AcrR family transcriptional regulator [Crossiella equi]|uniref:AcrR family transcriptional regulator n=1 Tax=Crossiella equi TaxID=130796 RepID=A0ABS5A4T5_9PSEU|nr:TetR/AcrR family transcriptional regulator [Crossiella equi]MBP2471593.1 AcrR family transcriptional regulator [Crossiella equi]
MATQAERGREVRAKLLVAATELVPERGWTAVSTRVLAERAGVAPSVVHYHFPSLRVLLNEAVLGAVRQVLAGLDGVLAAADSPGEAVGALLASLEAHDGADPTSLLFVEAYLAATRDEELRGELAGAVEEFRQRLADWLRVRGVPAPGDTAAVLAAAVDGLLLHRGLGIQPQAAVVLRRLVGEAR